jgi:hypothetical protein
VRLLHRQCYPARTQFSSIFNRHLFWFIREFFYPADRLVRTGKLADTTERATVKVPEAAVCTPLRTIEFREYDAPAVGFFSFLENFVRADLRTEVTALAPGLVNGEFHERLVLSYNVDAGVKKTYLL